MPAPGVAKPLKHFYEVPRDLLSRKGIQVRSHPKGLTGTLIIGDDTGLIKIISCKQKKVIKLWGEQNPIKRIKKLYWAHPINNNPQKEFLAVLSNGDIRIYNALIGSYQTQIKQETNIQGLYVMENPCFTEKNKRMIWTVNDNGDMRLWGLDYKKRKYLDQYQNEEIQFPTDTMILNKLPSKEEKQSKKKGGDAFINLLKSQGKKNKDKSIDRGVLLSYFNVNTVLKKEKLECDGKSISNVNNKRKHEDILREKRNRDKLFARSYGYNKGKIKCIKGHYSPNQFPWIAIGGNDRPVEIYDFNKQKCIFKGKHHYHFLGYKHEIIINDIDWSKKSINPYLCAAVTSQSEVKLYDVRSGKSMLAQKIGEYSLNKVLIKSKKKILVGDSNSNIFEFDYLKTSKERGYVYRRYRGFVGAIKDFDIHPTRNLLATVGLGRYAVVHRLNQPNLPLFKTYLKQKLNAVLFGSCYDTKYLPKKEEDDDVKNSDNDGDLDNFLNDTESDRDEEDEEEEEEEDDDLSVDEEDEDKNENGSLLKRLGNDEEKWEDKLDGYDTDELKELLDELKKEKAGNNNNNNNNNNNDCDDEPPLKKQKLDQ